MKRLIFIFIAAATLAACQESLEDRCAREAKSYTEKKCPAPVGENTVIDSIAFDRQTHTMCYYYSLSGAADDPAVIAKSDPYKVLLREVRNATSTKAYKDAGYNFQYTYKSAKEPEQVLFEATFTPKDYN